MKIFNKEIRSITAANVSKHLSKICRRSMDGQATLGVCTRPGAKIPKGLEIMDDTGTGGKVVTATTRGKVTTREIVTIGGRLPLGLIDGPLCVCWKERCPAS